MARLADVTVLVGSKAWRSADTWQSLGLSARLIRAGGLEGGHRRAGLPGVPDPHSPVAPAGRQLGDPAPLSLRISTAMRSSLESPCISALNLEVLCSAFVSRHKYLAAEAVDGVDDALVGERVINRLL